MKATTLFHGGPGGLAVGDMIRPAISLGKEHPPSAHQPHYSPHKVYVTQDREYAQFFAQTRETLDRTPGAVYEVRPIGRLSPDMDARNSFTCSGAEIVAVHEMLPLVTDPITDRINLAGGL